MSANIIDGAKIGILSDTHGSLAAWNSALSVFGDVSAVLHAGDVIYGGMRAKRSESEALAEAIRDCNVPLFIARGNCDTSSDMMVTGTVMHNYVSLIWNSKKIIMMHGDNFPLFRSMALECGADLAISGHTHVGSVVREESTIFLNPGSAFDPRGKDPASVAVADLKAISIITLDGGLLHREEW